MFSALMKYQRKLLLTALLILCSACSPPPETRLLERTAEYVVLPAYFTFMQASQNHTAASRAFCALPEEPSFTQVRQSWRDSASAWAALQMMPFGPITQDNTAWKIQFWPDRKNLVARKVEAWLRGNDDIHTDSLSNASVVIQGLSAAEYLLFDPDIGKLTSYQQDTGKRRCALLQTIAEFQENLAAELYQHWPASDGNYIATFTRPGPENPVYPDAGMAIAAIVASLVYGAELIKRDKVERPLGLHRDPPRPQPYLAEWWRSRYSIDMISANLNALHSLYSGDAEHGLGNYLAARGHRELSNRIDAAFQRALGAANNLDVSLFDAASDPRSNPQAVRLYVAVNELLHPLKNELPKALGVSLSFNSMDGD